MPESTWQALVEHHHPSYSFALAEGAVAHGRPEHAEAIYRALVAAAEGADPSEHTEVERWARGRQAQAGLRELHRSA